MRLSPGLSILIAVVPVLTARSAASLAKQNVTIAILGGTTDHGDSGCTPSTLGDVAIFFLANFVAHAATVKARPGEPAANVFVAMVLALLFPSSGLIRGLDAIFRHAITGGSPLQKAKKAGALCQVVRGPDWKPQPGDSIRDVRVMKIKPWQNSKVYYRLSRPSLYQINGGRLDDVYDFVHAEWTIRLAGLQLRSDLFQLHDADLEDYQVAISETRITDDGSVDSASSTVSQPLGDDASGGLELNKPSFGDGFIVPSNAVYVNTVSRDRTFNPSAKNRVLGGRAIHGICRLPPGYMLTIVEYNATVVDFEHVENCQEQLTRSQSEVNVEISSAYYPAKGLVAFFQALYAMVTLYETRGKQLDRYGCAAFGLTVAPYLVMSIINFISVMLTPDYPTAFMVESETMHEATRRPGAWFKGMVGVLKKKEPRSPDTNITTLNLDEQGQCFVQTRPWYTVKGAPRVNRSTKRVLQDNHIVLVPASHHHPMLSVSHENRPSSILHTAYLGDIRNAIPETLASICVGLMAVAINGGFTHFKRRRSTHAQLIWTMTWLAFGIAIPITNLAEGTEFYAKYAPFGMLFYCVPAIGGFVVVGQMLIEFGSCPTI